MGKSPRLGLVLVLLAAAACAAKPTPSSQGDDEDATAAGGSSATASGGASATGGMAQVGGGAIVANGATGGQTVAAGGTSATGVGGEGYGADMSGGATGLGGAMVNLNQACPTARPGSLSTNRLWVGVPNSVGGYLVTITAADSSSATFRIECAGDPIVVVRDGIQATLAGDPAVVDVAEDSKRVSLRYLSYASSDGPSDEVGAEMIVSQL